MRYQEAISLKDLLLIALGGIYHVIFAAVLTLMSLVLLIILKKVN